MSAVATPPRRRALPLPPRRPAVGRRPWVWLGVAYLVLVGVHLALSAGMPLPILAHDELGYLANARYLGGSDVVPKHFFSPTYGPGYSLLLAPLYALGLSPDAVYQGALVVNALLGASVVLIAYPLARRLFDLSPGRALAAATLAGAYPALLLDGNLVWAENLLLPLTTAWVLLGLVAAERGAWAPVLGFAALGAAAYAVHPRALPLAGLTLIWLAWLAWRRRRAWRPVGAGVIVLAAVLAGGRLLSDRVYDAVYRLPGSLGQDETADRVVESLTHPGEWPSAILRATGQVWYLGVASAGLALLGIGYLAWLGWSRRGPRRWGALLALAAVLSGLAVASLYLVEGVRMDWLFYGRYVEAGAPLMVLAGAAALLGVSSRRRRVAMWAATAAVGALAGVALYAGNGPDAFDSGGALQPLTVLGAVAPAHFQSAQGLDKAFDIGLASLVGGICLTLVAGLSLRSRTLAAGLAGVAFLASAALGARDAIQPIADNVRAQVTLTSSPVLREARSAAYDLSAYQLAGLPEYQFWLDRLRLSYFVSGAGGRPDSDLVISSVGWPQAAALGARLVAFETLNHQALWSLPGPRQRELAARGLLMPPDARLPAPAMRSSLRLAGTGTRVRLAPGATRHLRLEVTHRGSGAPWAQALPGGAPPVGEVVARAAWYPAVGGGLISTQFGHLPRTVAPGQRVAVDVPLQAIDGAGEPLAPGRYRVAIDMEQTSFRRFPEVGDRTLELELEVG